MSPVSAKQRLGCWLNERWRTEAVLLAPPLARALGTSWLDLCNRNETLLRDADTGGRVCSWSDSSRLTVARIFPDVGQRLMQSVLGEWPIGHVSEVAATTGMPEVSMVIPYGGTARRHQLQLTLLAALGQTNVEFEVIVVEQSQLPTLPGTLPQGVVYRHQHLEDGSEFNKCSALNFGVRESRGSALIVLDADYVLPARFAAECARALGVVDAVRPARLIFYLDEASTAMTKAPDWEIDMLQPEYIVANNPTPIAVRRSTYDAIGGHDEDYCGWGGEDLEFLDRLRVHKVAEGGWMPVLHAWHAPAPKKSSGDRNRALHQAKMAQPPLQRIAALLGRTDSTIKKTSAEVRS